MAHRTIADTTGCDASLWQIDTPLPQFTPLLKDFHTDVCVVGGGIAGLTTAYLLACENIPVTVLEAKYIGSGETGRSTAHLSNAFDDRYYVIERLHGAAVSQAVASSHTQAIDCIESIITKEKMDCGFERLEGYLFIPPGGSYQILHKEMAASHRAGLSGVEWIDRTPIPSLSLSPCLRFPEQAQLHPVQYLFQLAQAIIKKGGKIFDRTRVQRIQGGASCRIETSTGRYVTSNHVVVATNSPINNKVVTHSKQSSERTYVIGAYIPKGSITRALYWDTEEPYHYIRLQSGLNPNKNPAWKEYDILIVGGEDHRAGRAQDGFERYARLERWTRERFDMVESIPFRWSGHIQEPVDGLAVIGRNPSDTDNIYIATGDSGNGMTHGTIAAMVIRDLILQRENPWITCYSPSRAILKALPLKKLISHNFKNVLHYFTYLTPGEVKTTDAIIPGTGAVIRQGAYKVAAYRDRSGKVHKFSAVCRHLKCLVRWNPTEHTWDCPCHGSRYDQFGKVIQGPASEDLLSIED